MSEESDSARTMRIDIHPDFRGGDVSARDSHVAATGAYRLDTAEFLTLRDFDRDSEYDNLLESIYDAVIIADLKGRIIDINSRAIDFFRCSDTDLYGSPVMDRISGADDTLLGSLRKNLDDRRHTLIEAHCVRTDKSMFPAEIAVNKIILDNQPQLCFLIRDISIRKREQAALEDAIARLEAQERARTLFVSNVSHELRTPLTSMIYAVNNMLRGVAGPLSDKVRRYLELLDGDCHRLLNTVNDILDLRKIDSKTLTLAMTRVPLARLVKRTVESLMVHAEQKSIRVDTSKVSGSFFVRCDPQKMERVVLNIVGNAMKFTSSGGKIEVSIGVSHDDPNFVVLRTRDDGIGIPPEALPRVTERYFTVGEQASGCGLGLAISKEIVEMHQGKLELASPPPDWEKGTEVRVELPRIESPLVLVADDDEAILALLKMQLEEQGYRVMTVSEGIDAFDKIERQHPDLVVLDLVMPGMDGTEIILKMKSTASLVRVPIIVVTGAHMGRAKAEILSSFAVPAMAKPWQESELLDRVEGAFLGQAVFNR